MSQGGLEASKWRFKAAVIEAGDRSLGAQPRAQRRAATEATGASGASTQSGREKRSRALDGIRGIGSSIGNVFEIERCVKH